MLPKGSESVLQAQAWQQSVLANNSLMLRTLKTRNKLE